MCGIAGIVDIKNGVAPECIGRMTDAIAHRGPDAMGVLFADTVETRLLHSCVHPGFHPLYVMGHRRLAIIDLEGGAQPLRNEDGSVWITYNGEIYNHIELRRELIACGHRFISDHSDTEMIVHAYEQWGVAGFDRFNGIFAFGLLDLRRRTVVLARDHFGVKPLYYFYKDGRFIFASEIKAILATGLVERRLDTIALDDYLDFRYVPSPLTMFQDIFKLEAGGYLELDLETVRPVQTGTFISLAPVFTCRLTFSEAVEEYRRLFEQAVKRQLLSDVEVGALLSGGVDSAAVCAIAAAHLSHPLRTYTVGFQNFPDGNEFEGAERFAAYLGTRHQSVVIDAVDFISVLDKVAWFMDEPTVTSSAIPLFFLTKEIRKDVKVVLTGQGADEPLAGYVRYRGERLYRAGFRYLNVLRHLVELLPRQENIKRAFRSFSHNGPFARIMSVYALFDPRIKARLLQQPLAHRDNPLLVRLFEQYEGKDVLGKMLYMDTRSWLPDDLLMYGDKATMINSIEARVPMLDTDLIRFIERLPTRYKLSLLLQGKHIHKKACEKWLPRFVISRPKLGFATPIDQWFRQELGGYVRDQLLEGRIGKTFFDPRVIGEMITMHRTGRENYQRQLFALLMLEKWGEAYHVEV